MTLAGGRRSLLRPVIPTRASIIPYVGRRATSAEGLRDGMIQSPCPCRRWQLTTVKDGDRVRGRMTRLCVTRVRLARIPVTGRGNRSRLKVLHRCKQTAERREERYGGRAKRVRRGAEDGSEAEQEGASEGWNEKESAREWESLVRYLAEVIDRGW